MAACHRQVFIHNGFDCNCFGTDPAILFYHMGVGTSGSWCCLVRLPGFVADECCLCFNRNFCKQSHKKPDCCISGCTDHFHTLPSSFQPSFNKPERMDRKYVKLL